MKKIVLIGAGNISEHYIKVLQSLGVPFDVVTRGEQRARELEEKTGVSISFGGVSRYLEQCSELPEMAIVATGIDQLCRVSTSLIEGGIKKLLVEKPGSIHLSELQELEKLRVINNAAIYIAFNRRFYWSVQQGLKLIEQDGGVQTVNFEFTEWSHQLENKVKAPGIMENWFISNSIHPVDMAFYLGGFPKEIHSFTQGTSPWHPSAMQFSGAGMTDRNVPFSYFADWESAGRWSVEVTTAKRKLIFRPLEQLHIQERGSLQITLYPYPDGEADAKFKQGFFRMIKTFLDGDYSSHCTLGEMIARFPVYQNMAGYLKTL
jgi:predicted dehydrogenase